MPPQYLLYPGQLLPVMMSSGVTPSGAATAAGGARDCGSGGALAAAGAADPPADGETGTPKMGCWTRTTGCVC